MRARIVWIAAAALVLICLAALFWQQHHRLPRFTVNGHDFGAFYCAAKVAAQGHDPYRIEPLRACEHTIQAPSEYFKPDVVEPAPLLPGALALLAPLSAFDYRTALNIWLVIVAIATLIAALALARLTSFPFWVTLSALVVSVGFLDMFWGQLPAACILALSVAALCVRSGRFTAAGACAALSLVQPHVGLPACFAMLLWVPRARVALAVSVAAFGTAGILFTGIPTNIEYFMRMLPLHSLAEAGAQDQFSLTWLAFMAGLSDKVSVQLGQLSYLVMFVAGVLVARRLADVYQEPAFFALAPPAFAVLGGVFIHDIQISAAIPGALLLAAKDARAAAWAWLAVALLSVSWLIHSISTGVMALQLLALGAIVWYAARALRTFPRFAIVLAALVGYVAMLRALDMLPDQTIRHASSPAAFAQEHIRDADLASYQWGITMRTWRTFDHSMASSIAYKLPRWFALALLLALFVRAAAEAKPAEEGRSDPRASAYPAQAVARR